MIKGFFGEFSFLSNVYPINVHYEGFNYPSAEHAFQASKTLDRTLQTRIRIAKTPYYARFLGNKAEPDNTWKNNQVHIMRRIVRSKFLQNALLTEQLLATGPEELVNDNPWGEEFWGVYKGAGQNHLGQILMEIRSEITRRLQCSF